MAAPTFTAASAIVTGSSINSLSDPTGITPTAGGCIIVGVDLGNSGRTITVSDDQGQSYTQLQVQDNGTVQTGIFRSFGVAGVLTKVTVTVSGTPATIALCAMAFASPSQNDVSDGFSNSAATNWKASNLGITSSNDFAGVAVYRHNGSTNAPTSGPTGWTRVSSGNSQRFYYYQVGATGLVADTVAITFSGARTGTGSVATVIEPAGGGGGGLAGRIIGAGTGGRIFGMGG